MAILGKQLADGQLPNAPGVLYTCPVDTRVFIKSIICACTGAGPESVAIGLTPSGGVMRVITGAILTLAEVLYFDEPTMLDAGDAIIGTTTTATTVDYTISGATEAT